MRVFLLLLLLLVINRVSYAQNIVPNSSFEVADSCPTYINCCPAFYGTGYYLGCKYWAQGNRASPDYFNSCNNYLSATPYVGVPLNGFGRQYAVDGQAYTGAIVYDKPSEYKEYIMTRIPPLEVDTPYEVSFYISLADKSEYAVGGFGVLFTTYGSPDTTSKYTLSHSPQVDFSSHGIISDTANWIRLSRIHIPDSAYTALIIGSYDSSSSMDTLKINSGPKTMWGRGYYYFDKVTVQKLSTVGLSEIGSDQGISIQPNPARKTLFVYSKDNIKSVTINNLLGQVVFSSSHDSKQVQINVADLPNGIYVAKINGAIVKQFIKE